ncbi:hypothetical protein BDY19DRAFT_864207, partial [Irpex rosettiformis]
RKDIDKIVVVGGGSILLRPGSLSRWLKEYHRKEPLKSTNPEEADAYGVAAQSGIPSVGESIEPVVLVDHNLITLGIETTSGVMAKLIPSNIVI